MSRLVIRSLLVFGAVTAFASVGSAQTAGSTGDTNTRAPGAQAPGAGKHTNQTPEEKSATGGKPADNTEVNKRDRSSGEPTADQQKNNPSDLELTRKIRRSIVGDKSLSTYAHNVKIIAQNGIITLKGPVHSEAEKTRVEEMAGEVAGPAKVKSEIQVKQ